MFVINIISFLFHVITGLMGKRCKIVYTGDASTSREPTRTPTSSTPRPQAAPLPLLPSAQSTPPPMTQMTTHLL